MNTAETKALLGRWYDEMWGAGQPDLIPKLAGPVYTRHEMGGTRTVTSEEYRVQTAGFMSQIAISDLHYRLIGEGDTVCAIGTWRLRNQPGVEGDFGPDGKQWDWVQVFRAAEGRLVETWLSGIGMDSNWGAEVFEAVR